MIKIEPGKAYVTRDGRKMIPSPDKPYCPSRVYLLDTTDHNYRWTYNVSNGRLHIKDQAADHPKHLVAEWVEDVAPEPIAKEVKHIDQVNYLGHRKGIEKMWDSYRI